MEKLPELMAANRLRTNLERVRLLCELVKKREKFKREYFVLSETLVDRCMKPIIEIIKECLDKLVLKDHYKVNNNNNIRFL